MWNKVRQLKENRTVLVWKWRYTQDIDLTGNLWIYFKYGPTSFAWIISQIHIQNCVFAKLLLKGNNTNTNATGTVVRFVVLLASILVCFNDLHRFRLCQRDETYAVVRNKHIRNTNKRCCTPGMCVTLKLEQRNSVGFKNIVHLHWSFKASPSRRYVLRRKAERHFPLNIKWPCNFTQAI